MRWVPGSVAVIAGLAALADCGPIGAADLGLKTKSVIELRYRSTVRQRFDFSCGGAAFATILTHYWGRSVTEERVLAVLRARYPDPKAWQSKSKSGFSFDDLEFAATAFGFQAQGASIGLDDLAALEGPVIVLLDKGKLQHFSVLRKLTADTAYMSDPIVGVSGMNRDDFAKQYMGKALAVWSGSAALPGTSPLSTIRDGMSMRRTLRLIDRAHSHKSWHF